MHTNKLCTTHAYTHRFKQNTTRRHIYTKNTNANSMHITHTHTGRSTHLLLGAQLVKHVLDLQFPVLLQRVEGVLRHLLPYLQLQGCQLIQDGGEAGPPVRVLVPALCQARHIFQSGILHGHQFFYFNQAFYRMSTSRNILR